MSTRIRPLDRSMQLTHEWLHLVQEELKWPDEERIYDATKSVLRAIRDRLPFEEAHQLAAQFPMILTGVYFEGYDPSGKPLKIRTSEEFYGEVRKHFGDNPLNAEEATKAVIKMLQTKVTDEMENVKGNMPDDIKKIFTEAME
jgi:uncharacterized protein (DUF2267 family)